MKNDRSHQNRLLLFASLLFLSSLQAFGALSHEAPSLKDLVVKSPLIFEGRVTQITSKNSLPTEQNPKGLPYTFVTYQVLTPIHGKVGQTFTLRFLGGVNPDGIVMELSTYPHFDVGDHDIVMVSQNLESGCPLTGCENGRLRIVKDRAYSNAGNVLRKTPNGVPIFGSPQPLKEVRTRTIVHPGSGQKVVVETKGSSIKVPKPERDQMKRTDLIQWLKSMVANLPSPPAIASANPQIDFKGLSIPAVAPKQETSRPIEFPPQSPSDAEEEKQLEANDGNPVLN